jgi:hypothetical protein
VPRSNRRFDFGNHANARPSGAGGATVDAAVEGRARVAVVAPERHGTRPAGRPAMDFAVGPLAARRRSIRRGPRRGAASLEYTTILAFVVLPAIPAAYFAVRQAHVWYEMVLDAVHQAAP